MVASACGTAASLLAPDDLEETMTVPQAGANLGDSLLAREVAVLRQQIQALQASHETLREELALERQARVALEQRLRLQGPQVDNAGCGESPLAPRPSGAFRLTPPSGVPGRPSGAGLLSPASGQPSMARPSDMLAPSPRMLQRIIGDHDVPPTVVENSTSSCTSQLPSAVAGREGGPELQRPESDNAAELDITVGAGDAKSVPPGPVGSVGSNAVVPVEISSQLWAMEERWRRICTETAELRRVLEARQAKSVVSVPAPVTKS